jgi:hypothetical protein
VLESYFLFFYSLVVFFLSLPIALLSPTQYTTNKTIAVPSFVTGMKQKPNVPVDRVKNRLEQMDQDDEEYETLQLSQKDYIKHIEKKRESLIEAWDTDKRVKALKIAIKVPILLALSELLA